MAAITAATFLSYVLMHIFTYEDLDICVVVVVVIFCAHSSWKIAKALSD